jgi:hypothetical protein
MPKKQLLETRDKTIIEENQYYNIILGNVFDKDNGNYLGLSIKADFKVPSLSLVYAEFQDIVKDSEKRIAEIKKQYEGKRIF